MEGSLLNQIRLAVNGDYDKVILLTYSKNSVNTRILEDDIITVYGLSTGLKTYTSTIGKEITIPSVLVSKIDM